MARLIVAKSAGFCFGVERSVRMAGEALREGRCYCLGELIHNADAVAALEKDGLRTVERVEDVPEGERVLIRSHGEGDRVYEALRERSAHIIDATCPRVAAIHKIVRRASGEGRFVLIVGNASHPEVMGIRGCCERSAVVRNLLELQALCNAEPWICTSPLTVVFQTT